MKTYEIQSRNPIQATVRMKDGTLFSGIIHIKKNIRLSDELNNSNRKFIPMTDVTMSKDQAIELECVFLNTDDISYVLPEDAIK